MTFHIFCDKMNFQAKCIEICKGRESQFYFDDKKQFLRVRGAPDDVEFCLTQVNMLQQESKRLIQRDIFPIECQSLKTWLQSEEGN